VVSQPIDAGAFAGEPVRTRGIDASFLGLVLLAAVFFPRILTGLGAPSALNFAHFALAAPFVALALPQMREGTAGRVVIGLGVLFIALCASALLNGAGALNALLDFVLLSEPFLFLLLLVNAPMSSLQFWRFRAALLLFAVIHVALGLFQTFAGRIHDDVEGVFLGQGAGHHVAGAVALATAGYVLFGYGRAGPFWLRLALAAGCWVVAVASDSKQVVAAFVAALAGVVVLRIRDTRSFVLCVAVCVATAGAVWPLRNEIPVISILTEDWRLRGGLAQKASIAPLLAQHCDSPANWLLGLGPGHTVGRLGTSLLDYRAYLEPLGATLSPITREAIRVRESSEFSSTSSRTGSSVWSPLFFWAGLIGDLGAIGLASYLFLWWVVWREICRTALSQLLVLSMFVLGVFFSWLEEPSYMLFNVAILALEWQSRARAEQTFPRGVT
jgi:hypothetical protein